MLDQALAGVLVGIGVFILGLFLPENTQYHASTGIFCVAGLIAGCMGLSPFLLAVALVTQVTIVCIGSVKHLISATIYIGTWLLGGWATGILLRYFLA